MMRTVGCLALVLALETVVLWGIIGMNTGSTINYPSRGLIAWTLINTLGCIITQIVVIANAIETSDG